MPTFCKTWNDHMAAQPTSTSLEKVFSVLMANRMVAKIIHAKSESIVNAPRKPNSSEKSAKTKSVCASGKNRPLACVALPGPFPIKPPEPTAIFACCRL